jgi:hypothetical protein
MTAVKERTTRAVSLGSLIDNLWEKREAKRAAEAKVTAIQSEIDDLEVKVMERLDSEGLDKANGKNASVSTTTNIIAQVEDWEAFWAFIIKNKYTQLLQKRASDPAYRELLEMGKNVPGVKPFSKRRLNLRTSS